MDCVVSAFFLETGHNVIKYVEEIRKLLKPKGYWINIGSLSYAYESFENEVCCPLTYVFSVILGWLLNTGSSRNLLILGSYKMERISKMTFIKNQKNVTIKSL